LGGTTVRTTPSAGMIRIRFIGSSALADLSALAGSPCPISISANKLRARWIYG
jgi:hypothetical protein